MKNANLTWIAVFALLRRNDRPKHTLIHVQAITGLSHNGHCALCLSSICSYPRQAKHIEDGVTRFNSKREENIVYRPTHVDKSRPDVVKVSLPPATLPSCRGRGVQHSAGSSRSESHMAYGVHEDAGTFLLFSWRAGRGV